MSLSDCSKCWETPCCCGHGYKDMTVKQMTKFIMDIIAARPLEDRKQIVNKLQESVK